MSGHFLFELRKKPNSSKGKGWSVDVIWNGIPDLMTDDAIVHAMPRALKLDDKYHTFSKLEPGVCLAACLIAHGSHPHD